LDWHATGSQFWPAMLLSIFVLVGNPLIVMVIMGAMGYRRRTSFLAGLTVAQISEFSLIVAALGFNIGHVNEETVGLITLVGVVTIFFSTYMILYSGQLYNFLSDFLQIFERKNKNTESDMDSIKGHSYVDAIVLGMGNYGSGIAECLIHRNKSIMIVDFDPAVLEKCRNRKIPVIYGDMADPEMHEHLPLDKSKWIISSVRSRELNLALINQLKNRNYPGKIALTAVNDREALEFENAGASIVFKPFEDAAEQAVDSLAYAMDFLPKNIDWPVSFREIRIRNDSAVSGQTIKDISLGQAIGTNIIALTRAGQCHYSPPPNFRIYSGDRLVLVGTPDELKDAELMLNQFAASDLSQNQDNFEIAEVCVGKNSEMANRSLLETGFRQKYKATVIGIRREEKQITKISPAERIMPEDKLVVIGTRKLIEDLKKSEPL
ncbi:MAG TPA: TrkA C-terminal domain-containing protein, partial [Victivallales bacterium]|nr:TrkA C-terminal domain-containing protein [Victivallales bacterium]